MAENVVVAVEIASPCVSVQKLFPLPVFASGFVADTCVSDVGQGRAVSPVSFLSRAYSKMCWQPLESLRYVFPFKSYFHFRFPLPVSWPTHAFPLSTSSACKGDVGVPMWMKYCHVHAQIHEVPVENGDIPSLWNCTHFSAYPRSGRIPFPVTWYEIQTSRLLHFMWNWML